ncbi:quinon protein alcohol dehydrogenase-like superfamily [Lipomyces oligophaga]|uniref:quinon protein alcohol dehydrogenase-like superfamily n=1 Tax=Lipomyces oligophaga TaxID=45792 RepID=UPI0034CD3C7C
MSGYSRQHNFSPPRSRGLGQYPEPASRRNRSHDQGRYHNTYISARDPAGSHRNPESRRSRPDFYTHEPPLKRYRDRSPPRHRSLRSNRDTTSNRFVARNLIRPADGYLRHVEHNFQSVPTGPRALGYSSHPIRPTLPRSQSISSRRSGRSALGSNSAVRVREPDDTAPSGVTLIPLSLSPATNHEVIVSSLVSDASAMTAQRSSRSELGQPITDDLQEMPDLDCQECFEETSPFDDILELRDIKRRPQYSIFDDEGHEPVKSDRSSEPDTEQYQAIELLTADQRNDIRRRPYLTIQQRYLLRNSSLWPAIQKFEGMILHCDFTQSERHTIMVHVSQLSDLNECQVYTHLAQLLPGRTEKDIRRFFRDRCYVPENPQYIEITASEPTMSAPSSLTSLVRRESGFCGQSMVRLRDQSLFAFHVIRKSERSSGDIISADFSVDNSHFAIGNVASEDAYNRSGNCMVGTLFSDELRVLGYHFQSLQASERQYATVTAVKFSSQKTSLFSAGFDAQIIEWDYTTFELKQQIKTDKPIVIMKKAVINDSELLISALKGGEILSVNPDSNDRQRYAKRRYKNYSPSISTLDIVCKSVTSPKVIASYEFFPPGQQEAPRAYYGRGYVFELATGKAVGHLPHNVLGQDIFVHPTLPLVAFGAGPTDHEKSCCTVVQLYDAATLDSAMPKPVVSFTSAQIDINCVSISPCGQFVTTGGTDGSTYVFDRRFPTVHLHRLSHGSSLNFFEDGTDIECEDTGVETAVWVPGASDRFITGSSDGVLKLWDIRTGNCLKNLFTGHNPIMTTIMSSDGDHIIVGDTGHTIYHLSNRNDIECKPFNALQEVLEGHENSYGGIGMAAANELIYSGSLRVITDERGSSKVVANPYRLGPPDN